MKSLSTLVVFLLFASPVSAEPFLQVRPLDPIARESFDRGMARSPHFRALVARIEDSDVIVHIDTSDGLPEGIAGKMRFAGWHGGYRYLRVTLARGLMPDYRAATLGHELQHAVEVVDSDVTTAEGLRTLYTAIGRKVPGWKNTFETGAAADAGQQVWSELHGGRRSLTDSARTRAQDK